MHTPYKYIYVCVCVCMYLCIKMSCSFFRGVIYQNVNFCFEAEFPM